MITIHSQSSLRPARLGDLELLFAWRQDREIMKYLTAAPKRPTWTEHWEWWKSRQDRLDWMVVIDDGEVERSVGTVHYNLATGEIGLIIGEKTLWGQNVGYWALKVVLGDIQVRKDVEKHKVWAQIHWENVHSQGLFTRLGFEQVERTDKKLAPGHEEWVLKE